jgi:hypothetical protein
VTIPEMHLFLGHNQTDRWKAAGPH